MTSPVLTNKNIILNFCESLKEKLLLDNRNLENAYLHRCTKIEKYNLKKKLIFDNIMIHTSAQPPGCVGDVDHMIITSINSNNLLLLSIKSAHERLMIHKQFCHQQKGLQREKWLNSELCDKFTMMPFHDVEQEISAINVNMDRLVASTATIIRGARASKALMNIQIKDTIVETYVVEPFAKELRMKKEQLAKILCEKKQQERIAALQLNAGQPSMEELQTEVATLRFKLGT